MMLDIKKNKPLKTKGKVVSVVGNKTVKVACFEPVLHESGKIVNRKRIFICHDESLALKVGDTVLIFPAKRMSKLKSYLALIS